MAAHTIELLDTVAVKADVPELGLTAGEVGAVVEVLGDGEAFEVEFCDNAGVTYGLHTLRASQPRCPAHPRASPPAAPRSGLTAHLRYNRNHLGTAAPGLSHYHIPHRGPNRTAPSFVSGTVPARSARRPRPRAAPEAAHGPGRRRRNPQPHQGLPRLLGPQEEDRPQRPQPQDPQGRDLRPARPQRLRQDHHHQAAPRPALPHRAATPSSSASRPPRSTRTSASATCPKSRTSTASSTPRRRSTSTAGCSTSTRRRPPASGPPS